MRSKLAQSTKWLVDAVFPPRCVACGRDVASQTGVCTGCWSDLRFLGGSSCAVCDHPFPYEVEEGTICPTCEADAPHFDRAYAALGYDKASSKLVTNFKYGDRTQSTGLYADWMASRGKALFDAADVMCPVPLHKRRMLTRRYNQSALLARALARRTNVPLEQRLLVRIKHTSPQASLARSARLTNVKGCFAVRDVSLVRDKHVLLIDDVTTTGATINECARMLKKSGSSEVSVLTLAKTIEASRG